MRSVRLRVSQRQELTVHSVSDGLGRSLPHQLALDGTRMSVDICLDNCQVSGFQLCALQNGNECVRVVFSLTGTTSSR